MCEARGGKVISTARQTTPPLRDGKRLTRDEFLRRWEAMPGRKRAELLEGVVYMPSPVGKPHGKTDWMVAAWLGVYASATPGCDGSVESTWLMREDAPHPDCALWLLPEYGGKSGEKGEYGVGAVEFLAEIATSSKDRDLGPKFRLYQKTGVKEYLIVLLKERQTRWHRLAAGKYQPMTPDEDGLLRSVVFPGLWLNADALLAGDIAKLLANLQEGLSSKEHAEFVQRLARKKHLKRRK
jgi:Uma2 family endonuclease